MSQQVQINPVEQGYQIIGFGQYGIADGTIMPYDYDPDADPNTTPQQKLILSKILERIEMGDDEGYEQPQPEYQAEQPQYQLPVPETPATPPLQRRDFSPAPPRGSSQVYPQGYTGGGIPAYDMQRDTTAYIGRKTDNFMNKRWSWLDQDHDVNAVKRYSIYMRKQSHNATGSSKPRKKKKSKKQGRKPKIPEMFRI